MYPYKIQHLNSIVIIGKPLNHIQQNVKEKMNERGKYIYIISIWCNTQNRLNKQITTEVIKQEKEKKKETKQNK